MLLFYSTLLLCFPRQNLKLWGIRRKSLSPCGKGLYFQIYHLYTAYHSAVEGISFEMKLPDCEEPVAYGSFTKEQFGSEIEKGMEDIKNGRVYSADEVEAEMKREFGI